MKNRCLISLLLLIASLKIYGQELRVNNSFIIVVNEKVAVTSIAKVRLLVNKAAGKTESIEMGYLPGDLYFLSPGDKGKMSSDTVSNILLAFDSYEYNKGSQSVRNYQIPLNKEWFKYSFIVLKIHDLDKRKSLNFQGETYSYAMDFPGYSSLPIKKK